MCVGRVPNSENEILNFPLGVKLETVPAIQHVFSDKKRRTKKNDVQLTQDLLAVVTIWTKDALFGLNDYVKSFSETSTYRYVKILKTIHNFFLICK